MKIRLILWALVASLYYFVGTTQGFASPISSQFNTLTASAAVCANGLVLGCNTGAFKGGQDNKVAAPDGANASILKAISDDGFGGSAFATGGAFYGKLGADVYSRAPTATQLLYSQANATMMFLDAISATSITPGVTAASFDITEVFHGTLIPNKNYAEANGRLQIGTTAFGQEIYGTSFNLSQSGSETFHTQVSLQPGQVVFLYAYLYVQATTTSESSVTYAESDFANTASFYIDPITPGAELISASGHDYSAPSPSTVPEPSSLIYFCLGFAVLGISYFAKSVRCILSAPSRAPAELTF